jgi:hypothetical protein
VIGGVLTAATAPTLAREPELTLSPCGREAAVVEVALAAAVVLDDCAAGPDADSVTIRAVPWDAEVIVVELAPHPPITAAVRSSDRTVDVPR